MVIIMMREEEDSLGKKKIPESAYYGIQTLRAMENFPVSGRKESVQLVRAYIMLKKAAAMANMDLDNLENEKGSAIIQAADEILGGELEDQFTVDLFQAGAGTSFNMNINEVLANRALEIVGKKKGQYEFLSPNDDVNRSQSSNDTFPTASHIAIILESDNLYTALTNLVRSFKRLGDSMLSIPKSGRTHLMDAMPVTLGDEFIAYSAAVARARDRIKDKRDQLLEVAIGGTATGTGVNTPQSYRETVIDRLSEITSLPLIPAKNSLEALQSRSQMLSFSGALRELALELIRIANDLRLMGSGPTSGLNEIQLPPVQPGSSIMPGKVNPVMAECLNMICYQIIGNDTAVSLAAQAGQFELNVMTPVMSSNIIESVLLLNNYLPVFQKRCIEGIVVNEDGVEGVVSINPSLATLLSPKIGYLNSAKISKESLDKKQSIKELVVLKGILSPDEADQLFDLQKISKNIYR
jgi:aspartate ammonia-lyase